VWPNAITDPPPRLRPTTWHPWSLEAPAPGGTVADRPGVRNWHSSRPTFLSAFLPSVDGAGPIRKYPPKEVFVFGFLSCFVFCCF